MLKDLIAKALEKVTGEDVVTLKSPENAEFGDYGSNVAMTTFENAKLPASPAGRQMANAKWESPKEYAGEIVAKLLENKELAKIVEKIETAGPGFINFWLSKSVLAGNLDKVLKEGGAYGSSNLGKGKAVVIDYSSPNIAKAFGIGHLRSTIIGQALYNLYKALGYKVIGDNHLGDWGTQFGVLLRQVTSKKLQVKGLTIDKLEKLYVEFHKEAEEKPELWDEARAWFKKLEDGDKNARELWKMIVDISTQEFEKIYRLLGVKTDYSYGESFYQVEMKKLETSKKFNDLQMRGGDRSWVIDLTNEGISIPLMVRKSDGATTYAYRDLATIKFRIEKWDPDIFIYEVGSEQILHFQQVFAVARLMGWNGKRHYEHVAHGLIRFPHGKMSTRKGEVVKLEEVLDEAVARARKIIEKSETPRQGSGQAGRGLSTKERGEVARAVGIGAVKYFDLMHNPASDIIFDWDKMFLLEGNSAPYLQYTVARTNSVLAKSKIQIPKSKNLTFSIGHLAFNAEELSILRCLVHFPEVIEEAAKNYSPNLLCNYLFELAQKFNNFYNKHWILPRIDNKIVAIDHESPENLLLRPYLTQAVGQVLKNGLGILGIGTPDKM